MELWITIAAVISLMIIFGYIIIAENIAKERWMVERLNEGEGEIIYVVKL